MRVINVVTMSSGLIDEIKSFTITDTVYANEEKRQRVVEKAEEYFLSIAASIGETDDDFDEEDALDNAYYEYGDDEVHLIWSVLD